MSGGRHILIVGAGALGRGFLAPYFSGRGFEITFAEQDTFVCRHFQNRPSNVYRVAKVVAGEYRLLNISYNNCASINNLSREQAQAEFIFFCVGVKNLPDAARKVASVVEGSNRLKAVYSFENDRSSLERLKSYFPQAKEVNFGVPDVIVSTTAPPALMRQDPLCVVSEEGEVFVEGSYLKETENGYDDDYVRRQWIYKKFLHNTVHAAIAYQGALKGYRFVHEASKDDDIEKAFRALLEDVKQVLKRKFGYRSMELDAYAEKEITRFQNVLLVDPVARVGRNPEIKLSPDERLVRVARMLETEGLSLTQICRTIAAALQYPLCETFNKMRAAKGQEGLLQELCEIAPTEPLGETILGLTTKGAKELTQTGL